MNTDLLSPIDSMGTRKLGSGLKGRKVLLIGQVQNHLQNRTSARCTESESSHFCFRMVKQDPRNPVRERKDRKFKEPCKESPQVKRLLGLKKETKFPKSEVRNDDCNFPYIP